MPRLALLAASIALPLLAFACSDSDDGSDATSTAPLPATATEARAATAASGDFTLTSSAFEDNAAIPVKYGCDGDNTSPAHAIGGVPDGAQSLALTVVDPDAPAEGGFVHWTVAEIDPAVAEVPEDSVPAGGIEGPTSAGGPGYVGPCPPSGTHHYVFTLYAFDASGLFTADTATRDNIESAVQDHVLAQTVLTGTYGR